MAHNDKIKAHLMWLEELKALEAQKEALSKEITAASATAASVAVIGRRPEE